MMITEFDAFSGDFKKYIITKRGIIYYVFEMDDTKSNCSLIYSSKFEDEYGDKMVEEEIKNFEHNYFPIIMFIDSDSEIIYQDDNLINVINYYNTMKEIKKYNL